MQAQVTTMNLEDLGIVLTELFGVKEKWFNIGLQLSVPVKDLQQIFSEHKNDHSTGLRLMLIRWLEMGEGSWKSLRKALSSQIVEESSLAKKLKEKYSSSTGLPGTKRPSASKGTKRTQSEDTSAPNAKRPKIELPSSFAPDDFIRAQPSNRLCAKCRRVPSHPLRPNCCSHKVYCEPCSQKTTMCLTHHQDVVYTVDKELQTNVPKLYVHCPNRRSGCDFTDVLYKVYKEHLPTCAKKRSRPHNITLLSSEQTGSPHSPTTPTTPLATPITPLATPTTPVNSNPPSPMMMNRLKSSQRGSVPGSPVATQPPAPPRSPIEKPKHTGQATLKEMFSAESLAISQVGQQATHAPPSKQVYDQPVSKEMHVVTSETSQRVQQQQQPTHSIASSSGQQPSSVPSQARIANKTATEHAIITSSASTLMSACSANIATQQLAMPSNSSQTPVTSSTTVKFTSTAEATQSKRNTSVANTVTAQPQVAKQRANTLTAAALTRSPLRHQKASSTTNSTVSRALVKQPPNSQSSVLASSSSASVSFGQHRSGPQSSSSVAVGTQPCKASTSQPLLQQSQPFMSPTVAQNQPKSSIPNTSVIQTQQNSANMQAANALASQASPLQQIPVMVGLEYPPTLQQLQTLAMMGVQIPMCNLPLILQNSKQQSIAGDGVSNSAVCSQAVPVRQSAPKQSKKTANTGGGTAATKGTTQSKPHTQQNITGASSSVHISPNVAASLGAKGTNAATQKSNQVPTASIASSNISIPALGATMAQPTPAKSHISTKHTKLTASTSEKSANAGQKTQAKSRIPAECTKLATCTSEKSLTGAQKIPSKLHTSMAHTKSSLPTTSSSYSQAQEVTYLFTNTNSASITAPPSSVRTKTLPVSSNDSPVQKAVNATNTTPTSSRTTVPVKNGGRTASKRAAQPMHFSSTPTTSANISSLQTVVSSPISTTKYAPQVSLSAKKSLSFSSSTTTNSNSSHGGLQTTPASSRVLSSPISSSKGKLSAKLTKTSNSTLSDSIDRQKPQVNTVQSLLCTVCQLTPRNPLRSQCCGDLYCEPCSRRVDRCHLHRSTQLRFTRDVELFNVIQKQETKCKYAGNGCTWRGRVADQKQHITVCLYNPSRVQLDSAVKKEEKVFVPSPKASVESGSGMNIKKECTAEQQTSSSRVAVEYQACEYESIGCTERVPCGKMKLHLQEAIEQHLDLAIQRILLNETKLQ